MSSLINLRGLDFSENQVSDISALKNLPKLEWLDGKILDNTNEKEPESQPVTAEDQTAAAETTPEVPQTGDSSVLWLWAVLLRASGGLGTFAYIRKKSNFPVIKQ